MASTVIQRSAHVPYTARDMYELVADVPSYPDFLPWCGEAQIRSATESEVVASLRVARGPLRMSFTTRNRLYPHHRIEMRLAEGPFRHLRGAWEFTPLGDEGCRVSLHLEFELDSGLVKATLGGVFREIADSMLDAFRRRADRIYGGG